MIISKQIQTVTSDKIQDLKDITEKEMAAHSSILA